MGTPRTSLRALIARDWELFRDLRLRALAESPDAFGSTLGEVSARSEPDWRALVAACIVLQVTEGNAPAERLYASAGFAPTEEMRELRAGSPLRVRTMRLGLSAPLGAQSSGTE